MIKGAVKGKNDIYWASRAYTLEHEWLVDTITLSQPFFSSPRLTCIQDQ